MIWEPTTNPGYSVGITNLQDGFYTLFNIATIELNCRAVLLGASDSSVTWPIYSFYILEDGRQRRVVQSLRDSNNRWEFYESGEPLPFEEVDAYKERLKRKRLSRERIIRYAEAMGFPIAENHFWDSDKKAFYATRTAW